MVYMFMLCLKQAPWMFAVRKHCVIRARDTELAEMALPAMSRNIRGSLCL